MHNVKYVERGAHSQCLETPLPVILIFDRQGVFVLQGYSGIREVHAVFAQVLPRLAWVPIATHTITVCTICA